MAIVSMEHLYICALKKDKKQLLEKLQRMGAVEIADFLTEDSTFLRTDSQEILGHFDRRISSISKAIEVLNNYAPVKESMFASLAGRDVLDDGEYAGFKEKKDRLNSVASRLVTLEKTIADSSSQIIKQQTKMDGIIPWLDLPVPMSFEGTRTTRCIIGSLPAEISLEGISSGISAADPDVDPFDIEIISTGKDMTYIMVICPKSISTRCEEALRSMGFTRPSASPKKLPSEYMEELTARIEQAKTDRQTALDEIKELSQNRKELKYLMDDYSLRAQRHRVTGHLLQSKNTFILTGYVPVENSEDICSELNNTFTVSTWTKEVSPDEEIPILLKNNKFSSPVEGVLESYSLPTKNEVDPTGVMSIFYYFLFGLMLSDFAYGAILFIGAAIMLRKFPNMERSLRTNIRMFRNCGVSTMFWGIMFSSYFGDIVTIVSQMFFGTKVVIPPLWFTPTEDPMKMLVFCMAVGVVHLFTGLGMAMYQFIRQKRYYDAFCDVILWYGLVGSSIVLLLSVKMFSDIFQLGFVLPPIAGTIAGIIASISAVGIVLTAGRESKSWFKRILKGAYGLYNVTGYLSDILSYSRLLALGLATGVIGSVINQMGSMAGGGIVGAIVLIIVFVIGHSVNLGINALGAYVHTNRLQFVEFFGKFYEGGGRAFNPFGVNTKFFKFKEDKHHG